jgi:hypothetical protein
MFHKRSISKLWRMSKMVYFIFGYFSTKLGTSVDKWVWVGSHLKVESHLKPGSQFHPAVHPAGIPVLSQSHFTMRLSRVFEKPGQWTVDSELLHHCSPTARVMHRHHFRPPIRFSSMGSTSYMGRVDNYTGDWQTEVCIERCAVFRLPRNGNWGSISLR